MSGKFTRWATMVRSAFASLGVAVACCCCASHALADAAGSIDPNFFSGFTINEGQSGTAILQMSVSPANASGPAGTTTNRISGANTLTFASPGATSTPIGVNAAGSNVVTTNWNATFQYNLPGVYNVSYGGTVSWQHTANPSYSTGTDNGTGTNSEAGNINVTVNNVAPTITAARLNGGNSNTSVGQGTNVTLNMSATDAGSQNTNFVINGAGAGTAGGTPGSTRNSSTTNFSTVGLAPGTYLQTFQANDGTANASNGPIVRTVTVTNVGPTITSANLNGTNGNLAVNQGAALSLNLTATDPGNDTMSFTINGGGAGATGVQAGNSTRTSSTVAGNTVLAPGVYTQTFVATDQYGANASTTRLVTIVNVGPTVTAARVNGINGDATIAQGNGATLNMSATDPGLDSVNYTINGGGAGSSASGGNSSDVGTGTFLAPGVYTQTYQASDSFGGNSPVVTRNITVTNVAPTITSANQDGTDGNIVVMQGASVTLNLTATDPGNDTMSFTINGGGSGSTGVQAGGSTRTSGDTSVQYFTPGTFTNTFQATDQYGADATNGPATREVTVLNVAPVITSLMATEVPNLAGNGCLMFFTATSSDPGILDSAIYDWDLDGDGLFDDYSSLDPSPPWSSTTPTILYGLGSHTIGVRVTDNWGGFDPVNGVAYLTFECLPEPSTWVAILLSGGALAFFHRRKKRRT
ncbi:MAG: PEP-CTERM sorting domain-containing protein [Pirellulales bacterium]